MPVRGVCHVQSDAAIRADEPAIFERGDARDRVGSGAAAAHAAGGGSACRGRSLARRDPGSRRKADRQCLPGEILRHRRARHGGGLRRQSRHTAGQGADRRGRQARCRSRALRALGRHQPGHHRYRAGARIARGDRRPHHRNRSRDPGFHHARRKAPAYADGRAHLAAACAADAVRAESRGLCRGADARARAAEAGAPAKRWCCNSAAPPARSRRSARAASRSPIAFAKELDLPLPDGPWHTHRDRLADVAPAPSPCWPAPAARSRAMWRC